MRLLAVLLLPHLLGGCAVQVYMQKPEQRCRMVYEKGQGIKQVCDEGGYFKVKDLYVGNVMTYMAEQAQASPEPPLRPLDPCGDEPDRPMRDGRGQIAPAEAEKQEIIRRIFWDDQAPSSDGQ